MNEKERIQTILRGDISAFGYFVDTYQDMAITIAYRICHNRQDAEDIVQNSFVKAFHNLHTFRSDSKFSTWLYRIVYNTTISETQKAMFSIEFIDYREAKLEDQHSDWDTLQNIDIEERGRAINQALNQISEGESLILTLYYLEENSIKDISTITGLSEANIKVRLHRGRSNLRTVLENYEIFQNASYETLKSARL